MPFRNNFNYKIFQYILGLTICFIGYSLLIPLTLAIVNKEPTVLVFSISAVFSLILGYYLIYFNRNYTPQLTKKDGRIIVGLIWFVAP
ncbi:MAG: hypothetical protein WC108_08435, partial [Bacteroidales bacterium]